MLFWFTLMSVFLMDQTEKLFHSAAVLDDTPHRQTHLVNMVKYLVAYRPKCPPQELMETRIYNKTTFSERRTER